VNLGGLSHAEIRKKLKEPGLSLHIGPFTFRIVSDIESIADGLTKLYPDYPVAGDDQFVDYTVHIAGGKGFRKWIHPQAIFRFDGIEPFTPLPENHAFPLLEWAMNWCVSTQAHQYLILHSSVIERDGCAVIMPAPPGSGKSTLCAALSNRGWRLLSDELALISLADASITPVGRPISLKNQSIELIKEYISGAVFNRITHDTSKGSVTHLKVPAEQLLRIHEKAQPRWVIFPKYVSGAEPDLRRRSKASSMLELGRNSFNYMVLGRTGFETLSAVVNASDCYDFSYSQLDDALAVFNQLVEGRSA
jgi:HprK-related kinase A